MNYLRKLQELREKYEANIKIVEKFKDDPIASVLVAKCKHEMVRINMEIKKLESKYYC